MSNPDPVADESTRHDLHDDSATAVATRVASRHGGAARDVLLVVLGAGLALAADEWRDARQRRARVTAALAGIAIEIGENNARVAAARARHLAVVDTLDALVRRGTLPPPELYLHGMFNPAPLSSTAWQAARETGALGDMPLDTVLALAPAYEAQERYRALAEAITVGIMGDLRRDGVDAVLRDRFRQFIPLATDFAKREEKLLEHYAKAVRLLEHPH